MPLVDHLEELRQRVLRSLGAVVICALACLLAVRPLVRLLEEPAGSIRFLQLAPGEFLFVSFKVAGYAGLTLALPFVLYQGLAFVLPGLTRGERRLMHRRWQAPPFCFWRAWRLRGGPWFPPHCGFW